MVFLGPLPMLAIGQLAIFSNRPPRSRGSPATLPIYAVFLVAGSLLARPARERPRACRDASAWFSLAVVVLFVATGAQHDPRTPSMCAPRRNVRIERSSPTPAAPALGEPRPGLRNRRARLPRRDGGRGGHRVLGRHPHRLLAPAARPAPGRAPRRDGPPARRRRPGAARRPRAHHPRLPRRPRSHDRAPLRRRRALRAAHRAGRRVLGLRSATSSTPPPSTTTSARSCSPTASCSRRAS